MTITFGFIQNLKYAGSSAGPPWSNTTNSGISVFTPSKYSRMSFIDNQLHWKLIVFHLWLVSRSAVVSVEIYSHFFRRSATHYKRRRSCKEDKLWFPTHLLSSDCLLLNLFSVPFQKNDKWLFDWRSITGWSVARYSLHLKRWLAWLTDWLTDCLIKHIPHGER